MNLDGKSILITGATSGIGYATARRCIEAGARVYAVGRNRERLQAMSNEWPTSCTSIEHDLAVLDSVDRLVTRLPGVDGVVLSAGIVRNNPIKFFQQSVFDEIMRINLLSPLALVISLANAGKLTKGGSIAFLSSVNGTAVGIKGTLAYATTKAGLTGAAKVLALELSGKQIRVNSVAPGMVSTELVENLSQLSDDMVKADMAKYPLGKRYARADEVADVLVYLLSDRSSFITGQTITIDGGYSIQ